MPERRLIIVLVRVSFKTTPKPPVRVSENVFKCENIDPYSLIGKYQKWLEIFVQPAVDKRRVRSVQRAGEIQIWCKNSRTGITLRKGISGGSGEFVFHPIGAYGSFRRMFKHEPPPRRKSSSPLLPHLCGFEFPCRPMLEPASGQARKSIQESAALEECGLARMRRQTDDKTTLNLLKENPKKDLGKKVVENFLDEEPCLCWRS
ncbi:hypothetical protein SCHPADRAFT_986840 [Schizopora paradoxa]|uniref:Uncharacterized protein n=1 Tax=Schizopora paradoxa TaxID=27342 RepID=A0A0H2R2V8_9AGAM|nr:hypothetical protein SCHPADRAFT_986840 [Schizopora paradoxa]